MRNALSSSHARAGQPHWWVSLWTQLTTVATTSVNQNRDGFPASNVLPSMMKAVLVAMMMMMMVAVAMLSTTMWTMAATMATATLAAMVLTMGAVDDDIMFHARRLSSRECCRGPRKW